jgi:excinuclease ABC subunit A
LHFDDIRKLLDVLHRLVDLGNTVIVVEHNLDVIKTADWIIEMGPEAGEDGGRVVFAGTPEHMADTASRGCKPPEKAGRKQGPPSRQKSDLGLRGAPSAVSPGADTPGSPVSHTAPFIAAALHAGPHAERPRYDPHAAEKKKEDDVPLEAVGKDAAMPWEIDGKKWHTQDRLSHNGQPCHWEGRVLSWVEEKIHELGEFAETNWKQPTTVEIAGRQKSLGWFVHAHTAMEWLVRLVFRVGKNTFKQDELDRRLAIPALNDTEGLQVYGDQPRVKVANRKGPWQEVWMLIHRLSEIDTPAFQRFLQQAVASFEQNVKRMQTKPEDVMPWKVNGERWHLSEKGFPPGRKVHWDRSLLARLVELVKAVAPKLEIEWSNRAAVSFRLPGMSRLWAQWRTKDTYGLDCRFLGKKGQFNLSQVENIGVESNLRPHKDGEILHVVFQHENHVQPQRLKELLAAQIRGLAGE